MIVIYFPAELQNVVYGIIAPPPIEEISITIKIKDNVTSQQIEALQKIKEIKIIQSI